MAQLRVTSSALNGQAFNLEGDYYTIGREADNTICLPHQSISKHHAMITVDKGDFKLWDLHSTNGLVINGEKTVLRHLKDGDKIALGDVEFVFASNGFATPVKLPPQAETQRIVLPPPVAKPLTVATPKPLAPVETPLAKAPEPNPAKPVIIPAPILPVNPPAPTPPVEPKLVTVPTPQTVTPAVLPQPPALPSEPKPVLPKESAPLPPTNQPPATPVAHLNAPASESLVGAASPPRFPGPERVTEVAPPPPTPRAIAPPAEPKPVIIPAPQAVATIVPPPLPLPPKAAPSLSQTPPSKIETPVVTPVPTTPPPKDTLPAAELKSIPPMAAPLPNASPSKAETKEIHVPPTPPDVPKIKVSMDLHPRPPLTPVSATPAPVQSIANLPKDLKLQPPAPEAPPVATAPEPTPDKRPVSGNPRGRRLIYLIIFLAGLGLLMTGYAFNITGCKFIGFILAITGFICLYFAVRFKGIIAPPR